MPEPQKVALAASLAVLLAAPAPMLEHLTLPRGMQHAATSVGVSFEHVFEAQKTLALMAS